MKSLKRMAEFLLSKLMNLFLYKYVPIVVSVTYVDITTQSMPKMCYFYEITYVKHDCLLFIVHK